MTSSETKAPAGGGGGGGGVLSSGAKNPTMHFTSTSDSSGRKDTLESRVET